MSFSDLLGNDFLDHSDTFEQTFAFYTFESVRVKQRYLRFALEGRLRLHLKPPAYNEENWKDHEDLATVKEVVHTTLNSVPLEEELLFEDEYSEEEDFEDQAIASCSNKFKLLHSDE